MMQLSCSRAVAILITSNFITVSPILYAPLWGRLTGESEFLLLKNASYERYMHELTELFLTLGVNDKIMFL